jgi:enterochelin esterase family protein
LARAQVSIHLPAAIPSPFMTAAVARVRAGGASAVTDFWTDVAKRTTPIIERFPPDTSFILVTFIYRDTVHARTIQVSGGAAGWDEWSTRLAPIAGTDIWYKTVVLPRAVRVGYQFRVNDDQGPPWYKDPNFGARFATWHGDELNPNVDSTTRVRGARSKLIGPGADPQLYTRRRADVPHGTLDSLSIDSKILGQRRRAWIYMPPSAAERTTPVSLLVLFDGGAYTSERHVPTPTILDNMLAARKVAPVAALFIDNGAARMTELGCDSVFVSFVVDEVLPVVHLRYSVTNDPARTAIGGSSQGGLAAMCAAFRFPRVFGNVISQSASYWWAPAHEEAEWPARAIAAHPKLPLRFYLDVGLFETDRSQDDGPGQVSTNRHFRDVLRAKGYDVFYQEFPGAHEYFNWRGTISTALERFFPPQ